MAFHPYPRVIPPVFNPGGFGPPRGLTPASACPRIAHPASRPPHATESPCSDSLSLRLAFRLGLAACGDSLAHSTKGTPSQMPTLCSGCSGARGFRCCFTPLSGCFSPFPHGTGSLSVAGECSALEGGPPGFGPGSSCPALLGKEDARSRRLRLRGCHPVPPAVPGRSAAAEICHRARGLGAPDTSPRNPAGPAAPACDGACGLGIARVRSPLLARSRLISLPPGT